MTMKSEEIFIYILMVSNVVYFILILSLTSSIVIISPSPFSISVQYPKYVPKFIKNQLSDLLTELEEENIMDQREKMDNVTKLILRRKIEKEAEKTNREIRV